MPSYAYVPLDDGQVYDDNFARLASGVSIGNNISNLNSSFGSGLTGNLDNYVALINGLNRNNSGFYNGALVNNGGVLSYESGPQYGINWGNVANLAGGLANIGIGAFNAFNAYNNYKYQKEQLQNNRNWNWNQYLNNLKTLNNRYNSANSTMAGLSGNASAYANNWGSAMQNQQVTPSVSASDMGVTSSATYDPSAFNSTLEAMKNTATAGSTGVTSDTGTYTDANGNQQPKTPTNNNGNGLAGANTNTNGTLGGTINQKVNKDNASSSGLARL